MKKNFKYLLISILIALVLECTIFQINFYRTHLKKYEEKVYNINDIELENAEINSNNKIKLTSSSSKLILNNINTEVATIYLDLELPNTGNEKIKYNKLDYKILYTDETSENFRGLFKKTFINTLENSKYFSVYLSGKSKKVAIEITDRENMQFKINKIIINKKIPFNFNIARFSILFLVIFIAYSLKKNKFWNTKFEENKKSSYITATITTLAFVILAMLLSYSTSNEVESVYSTIFTDSLLSHKLYLTEEPSKELLSMENPYDYTVRDGSKARWDTAFYNGKYYVYFGILPQILLYIPYYKITGNHLYDCQAVIIFSVIFIIGISILYFKIFKKYFGKLDNKIYFFSSLIILFGSLSLIMISRPQFYEMAVMSNLSLSVLGYVFMFDAFTKEKFKYLNIFIGSWLLAGAVACRPTSLFYSLIIVIPYLKLLINNFKNKKNRFKSIISIMIPYLVIGFSLMVYNYLRFDSPFDFGANYQLTVNDIGNLKYRYLIIPFGIIISLFKLPKIEFMFPYFSWNGGMNYNIYMYERVYWGIFIGLPILFSIFKIKSFRDCEKNKEIKYLAFSGIIITILIMLLSIYCGGTSQRYVLDYTWILLISALLIYLSIYQKRHLNIKQIMKKALIIVSIYTIIFISLYSIVGESNFMLTYHPKIFYYIKYAIEFWY